MSKLASWLEETKTKRKDFAERIGVAPSLITMLCSGAVWPGRDVASKIRDATGGAVTPDDFLSAADDETVP